MGDLGKKTLTNIPNPLAKDNLPGLVTNLTSNAINIFDRKISGKVPVRAEKEFTLFISNKYMNITKIIKSFKDSGVLIDGATETAKDEIKKQEASFLGVLLAPLAASLVQLVTSSVVKGISGRGVRKAWRGYKNKNV